MTLRPLMQSNYWRVQMAWPDSNPRCFGKFHSRTEAEEWIAEHQWLTKLVWAEDYDVRRNFESGDACPSIEAPDEARRIAANIAELPGLLRTD